VVSETVSLQIRMDPSERDEIRRLAEAEGLTLRELLAEMVKRWAGAPAMPGAMTVSGLGALGAMRPAMPGAMPDLAGRVAALEARVGALERRPTTTTTTTRAPRVKRRTVPTGVGLENLPELPELPGRMVELLEGAGLLPAWPTTGADGSALMDVLRDDGILLVDLAALVGLSRGAMRSGIDHYRKAGALLNPMWVWRLVVASMRALVDPGWAPPPGVNPAWFD